MVELGEGLKKLKGKVTPWEGQQSQLTQTSAAPRDQETNQEHTGAGLRPLAHV